MKNGELATGDVLVAEAEGNVTNVADTAEGNNKVKAGYKVMNGTEDVTAKYTIKVQAGTLTVTPKKVDITAASESFIYDGTEHSNTGYEVTGTVGTDAINAVVTGSITYPSQGKVPNKVVSHTFTKGLAGNYTVNYVNGELTMEYGTPLDITIEAASQSFTYDGASHSNSAVTVKNGELATGDVLVAEAEGSVTNVADTAEGNNKVKAGYKVMNGTEDVTAKYNITDNAGTLTVTPKDVTITVNSASKNYGQQDTALTFTGMVGDGDLIDKDDLGIVTYGRMPGDIGKENVGDDITLTAFYESNANYTVTIIPGKLTIVASDENAVVITGRQVTYDGSAYGLTDAHAVREGSTLHYSTDNVTFTEEAPTFTEAGVYVVYVKATNPNYSETAVVEGKVIINKRNITFTAGSASKTYDGNPLTNNSTTITSGTIADGQTWTVKVTGSQTAVGTSKNVTSGAVIRDGERDVTANYNISYISGDLTVTSSGGSFGGGGGGSSSGGGPSSSRPYTNGGPGDTTVTIDPGQIPLASLPEDNSATNLVLIDDGNIPLAGLPKTGDKTPVQGVAEIVSGLLLAAYMAISRRRRDER